MKIAIRHFLAFFIIIPLLIVLSFAIDPPSEWATASIDEAVSLELIPTDLQGNYQDDITRAEFARISIFFLAAQYNYQTIYVGRDGNEYCSAEEFIEQFIELRRSNGIHMYQQSQYWSMLPPYVRADAEMFGQTPEQYSWRGLLSAMNPFADSDDPAYYDVKPYINAAYVLGIVKGREDGSFGHAESITRQEAASMLLRTYEVYCNEIPSSPQSKHLFDIFSDAGEIGTWAQDAVAQMVNLEIMNGIDQGTFAPKAHYTREQCYTTFLRLYQNAPTSRYQNNVLRFSTLEEDISLITGHPFFNLRYRCDTDLATIIHGTHGGMIGMGDSHIYILYVNGGKRSIATVNVDPLSFSLSDDQLYLSFYDSGKPYKLDIKYGVIRS